MNAVIENPMGLAHFHYPASLPSLDALSCELIPYAHLNGEEGVNRGAKTDCQLEAVNDFQAIYLWLKEYQHKATTYRLYQKEAERLVLWSLYEKKKALSSLTRQDLEDYFCFIRNPIPREIWCGKRGAKRGSTQWRPFEGKLSAGSIRMTIAVLNSLFSYLEESLYLKYNPFRLMRKKLIPSAAPHEECKLQLQSRILEQEEWDAMKNTLEAMPENNPHEKDEKWRLKLIVAMLFLLGLRVSELVSHTWSAFRLLQGSYYRNNRKVASLAITH